MEFIHIFDEQYFVSTNNLNKITITFLNQFANGKDNYIIFYKYNLLYYNILIIIHLYIKQLQNEKKVVMF